VRKTAFFSGEQRIVLSELGRREVVMGTIMMVLDDGRCPLIVALATLTMLRFED